MSATIAQAFATAAATSRAAFVPFVSGGFPSPAACSDLVISLDALGAEVIELGVPFSDPLADGPVIQAASHRALTAGMTPAKVLDLTAGLAPRVKAALVLMTYYNPVARMGLDEFAQRAAGAGAAGVIVPDLPPEEAGPWRDAAATAGLDTIFMAAPTTPQKRLPLILEACSGFLYYVSLTGVTGSALSLDAGALARLTTVREACRLPMAVGFGVAGPEQAAALADVADGVIVGSALMRPLVADDGPAGVDAALALAGSIYGALCRQGGQSLAKQHTNR